jgi:eukaryotic-like serine/threonine-protein kinase
MGEVYRALDTRLQRIVAVKILPSHLSENPEAKERFDREARTISSLNHPHICTLHDVGHQNGVDYLVMEYLEGETLASRLDKGALAPDQVLRYGIEICEGLEMAHRAGIVHRDLKPGNIMLTKTGVKLMDFGLAKSSPASASAAASLTVTLSTPAANSPLTGFRSPFRIAPRPAKKCHCVRPLLFPVLAPATCTGLPLGKCNLIVATRP